MFLRRSLPFMLDYLSGIGLGISIVLGMWCLYILIVSGGDLGRAGLAWMAFKKVLGDAETAAKVKPLVVPPEPGKGPKLSGEPLRLLALLQRESRLLDFLLEDVAGAPDDQLGAGVRDIHGKARTVLREHLVLEPVLAGSEGDTVTVPAGFDPSAIAVTGNVTGQPPFKGTLLHPGWRVKEYKLAAPPQGQDELVVAPARVELP
jgi:hypothetical protein